MCKFFLVIDFIIFFMKKSEANIVSWIVGVSTALMIFCGGLPKIQKSKTFRLSKNVAMARTGIINFSEN